MYAPFPRILSLLFLTVSFGFSLSAQNYQGKQKDIDKILKGAAQFSEYYMAKDGAAVAGLYTEDAKIFPNNREILSGEDLVKYWEPSPNVKVLHHKITPVEIKVMGKTAYDYGYYEGTTQAEGKDAASWRGKYVIIWKKVGKEWKIYMDIWNRIAE